MKYRYLILVLIILIPVWLFAANDSYIINQQRVVRIMPLFQSWEVEDSYQVGQVSMPMFLYVPLTRQFSFSLRGNGGSMQGDYPELSGMADVQLMMNYHLESKHLVFNLGMNIPNGKNELTAEEFSTSAFMSSNYFKFQIPSFGQGFNISPGVTWAYLVNDNFAIGLGASYQYKGKFKPLKYMIGEYAPGDEFLLTGGGDYRINKVTTLSADMTLTMYSPDYIGESKVYASGNTFMINIQFKRYFNYHELWISSRYRTKGKNSYMLGGIFQEEPEVSTPVQFESKGHFRMRLSPKMYLAILGEVRSYMANSTFTGLDIFGIGLSPIFKTSDRIRIPVRVKFYIGDFASTAIVTGWELGIGMEIGF